MIYAINYANKKWYNAQKLNSKTAKKYGADKVIAYTENDIDKEFYEKNKHILTQPRGNGYWLWKPYIIKKTLDRIEYGDYVIYIDSGACYKNDIHYLINKLEEDQNDIMCFGLEYPEKKYTKRDAFILMDCDTKKYTDSNQILGGFILIKKTDKTINLVTDWLNYAQDYRIITDSENECGKPNYAIFVENRHDQTVFSLTCKKYNCRVYYNPSQENPDYPQIIDLHRYYWCSNMFMLRLSKFLVPKVMPIINKLRNRKK